MDNKGGVKIIPRNATGILWGRRMTKYERLQEFGRRGSSASTAHAAQFRYRYGASCAAWTQGSNAPFHRNPAQRTKISKNASPQLWLDCEQRTALDSGVGPRSAKQNKARHQQLIMRTAGSRVQAETAGGARLSSRSNQPQTLTLKVAGSPRICPRDFAPP